MRSKGDRVRVAVIAPPWYRLPPWGYGGIELVVSLLVRALRARGDEVVVVGAEWSEPCTIKLAPAAWEADLGRKYGPVRELTYLARVARVLRQQGPFDVIHDHSGFAGVLATTLMDIAPVVHTVHGSLGEPERTFYRALQGRADLVAISVAQRGSAPELPWHSTVHNAVDIDSLLTVPLGDKGGYLLCLARICPEKGQHVAIEVARRTGRRLVLAGKVDPSPEAQSYFQSAVAPHIDGSAVIYHRNVFGREKSRLIARAAALLAPIAWAEPFGLSAVEAMASGTPAVSYARGAAIELIDDGVTGFAVKPDDVEAMTAAVLASASIDTQRCAQSARRRFNPARMAENYHRVYAEIAGRAVAKNRDSVIRPGAVQSGESTLDVRIDGHDELLGRACRRAVDGTTPVDDRRAADTAGRQSPPCTYDPRMMHLCPQAIMEGPDGERTCRYFGVALTSRGMEALCRSPWPPATRRAADSVSDTAIHA
jgi:glycosyltransferase involved in cell wall biosynthesis